MKRNQCSRQLQSRGVRCRWETTGFGLDRNQVVEPCVSILATLRMLASGKVTPLYEDMWRQTMNRVLVLIGQQKKLTGLLNTKRTYSRNFYCLCNDLKFQRTRFEVKLNVQNHHSLMAKVQLLGLSPSTRCCSYTTYHFSATNSISSCLLSCLPWWVPFLDWKSQGASFTLAL